MGSFANTNLIDNLPLIISIAALAFSLLSPLITALITGAFSYQTRKLELKHEQEMERLKFYDMHRAEVIERYVNAAGKLLAENFFETQAELNAAAGELYLYVDDKLWPEIDKFDAYARSDNKLMLICQFRKLCKELSHQKARTKN